MKENEGYVIVISLVVAAAALLLLGVFLGSIVTERKNVEKSYHSAQALNLAEAGVEKAIWQLNNSPASAASGEFEIEGIGSCDYTTTISGDTAIIQASGYSPGINIQGCVTRKVKVTAECEKLNLFNTGVFAVNGPIEFVHGSMVDSYDSTAGSYEDQAINEDDDSKFTYANSGASVGTSSTDPDVIQVDDSSKVFGSVSAGIEVELPQPTPPASFDYDYSGTAQAVLSISGSEIYEISTPGTYRYDVISISGNGVLEINAPGKVTIYVAGDVRVNDLDVTGNGEIRVATGTTVEFYVGGNLKVAGNGIVNSNSDPSSLAIYGTEQTENVQIQGNAAYCGLVYAPGASVTIKGATDKDSAVFYGAVVANSIYIGPHGSIHYDETLKERTDFLPSWASIYRAASWEET